MKIGNSLNAQEAASKRTNSPCIWQVFVNDISVQCSPISFTRRTGIAPGKNAVGSGGANAPVSSGHVKQFAIGDFEIRNADINFVDLKKADHPSAYLLGIGELECTCAIRSEHR